jgi:putative transposase
MTRFLRIVVPGWVHHVTQRGNHRQTVFFSDQDRHTYLSLLQKYFSRYELGLIGFCLMDNHVHLLVIPHHQNSLADGVGQLHRDFARWQNIQCNRIGHLWQSRFFSCPVGDEAVWEVLSYVELNRVRAGLVDHAWDWDWCSSPAHVAGVDRTGLLDMHLWQKHFDGATWRQFLERALAQKTIQQRVRNATATGRLLGNVEVAKQLEQLLGRPILPRKKGRRPAGASNVGKLGN